MAITKLTTILKQAAHLATPATNPCRISTHLPSKIKCLVALKRKARATWQKIHAPEDRRLFNNATNNLKTALHTLRNTTFATYVSSLSNLDHSLWKSIKSKKKPHQHTPPFGGIPHHRDHGQRVMMTKSSTSRATEPRFKPHTLPPRLDSR